MKIIIVRGTYGYRNENGIMEPKDINSPAFHLEDSEAERLIRENIAEQVPEQQQSNANEESGDCISQEQLLKMNLKELKKMAKDMGVSAYGSREEITENILTAYMETEEDNSEAADEELPDLTVEEPEEQE